MVRKNRLVREEKTLAVMIEIFCRGRHGVREGGICEDCSGLLDYARERLKRCPFGADKGPCAKCEAHCYKPEMQEKVKAVMRYSGPKMIKMHPMLAINHLLEKRRGPGKKS